MRKRVIVFLIWYFVVSGVIAQICGTTANWSNVITYNTGDQVQYLGIKYEAKWFTRSDDPDLNSGTASSPWAILGNCDGSVDTLSCDGLSVWLVTSVYTAGQQVIRNNQIYTANFWTLNQDPELNNGGAGSPWTFIGACESTTQTTCDLSTPSFTFDLTGSPDSLWVSPQVRRDGLCCSIDPSERPPARCVEFFFTLDEDAIGIIFDINSGAVPPGALFFQINCQGRYQFGDLLCLSGPGPYRLTFCKPGNNPNTYGIQSIGKPKVSPPVTVSDGCSADLFASGYDLSTVRWTSVPSDPVLESYLSCTSQCDSVHVTYEPGAPDSVVYQVSGFPPGGCLPDPVVQQTVVYFVNDKSADIQPKDAMVCFGANTATLTVTPSGGRPPHSYLWSTGETTQSIQVGQGTYSVEVFDNTTCPSASDSVLVGAFLFPIRAEAGPDQRLCESTTEVQLQGQIFEALGGVWSGGAGTFLPNDSTLNARYVPTAIEKVNGVTLTLTTTGNRSCPGDADQVVITFDANPTLIAPDTVYSCLNNPVAQVSATFTDATFIRWEPIGGGTIQPNDSSLTISYTPTVAELIAQSTIIRVTADGNPSCPAISDTVNISFTQPPSVNVGPDQATCSNNPSSVVLTATPTIAGGVVWSGGVGTYAPSNTGTSITYTPTLLEAANPFMIMTATTIDNKGCLPVSETIRIDFGPAPSVQVIPDFTVCESSVSIPVSATTQNSSGVIWSGGSFTSTTSLSTNYLPTAADVTNGFIDVIVTTTNTRGCLDDQDNIRITLDQEPQIDIPAQTIVCSNNRLVAVDAIITLADSVSWIFSGTGTTTIVDENSAQYLASVGDTVVGSVQVDVQTISTSVCPEASDNGVITFSNSPVLTVSGDQLVCANNSTAQLNVATNGSFGVLWTGGSGTFVPDRISANAQYIPSSGEVTAGSVTLTATTTNIGDCLPSSSNFPITINPAPQVDAGSTILVCGDQPSITLAGSISNSASSIWQSNTGGTFGDSGLLSTTYTFSSQDIQDSAVTLLLTTGGNAPCLEVSDFVTIRLEPVPMVDAGADITLCTSQDSALVIGLVTIAGAGSWATSGTGTFSPSNTSLSASYIPSPVDRTNGSVTLTLTSSPFSSCNIYSDQTVLSFANGPVLDMQNDSIVCRNTTQLGVSAQGSLGEWAGNGGNFLFPIGVQSNIYIPSPAELVLDSTTLYYTTFAAGLCPSINDSVTFHFIDGPTLTPLLDDTICSNVSTKNYTTTTTNALGVKWTSSGFGSFSPNDSATTIDYTLSSLEQSITDTLPITLTVRTTGNGACDVTVEQVELVLIPQNDVDAGASSIVCFSQGIISLSAQGNPQEFYSWSTTGGGDFVGGNTGLTVDYQMIASDTLLDSIKFVIESTNNPYCSDFSDSLYFSIITGPTVEAGNNQQLCKDIVSVTLNGTANKQTSQQWTTSGTGSFINSDSLNAIYLRSDDDTITGTVTLYLSIVGEGGCDQLIDSLTITFESSVIITADSDFEVCKDSSNITLNATVVRAGGFAWQVIEGFGALNDTSLQSPTYTLSINDKSLDTLVFRVTSISNNGCFAQNDEVKIGLLEEPLLITNNVTICKDATVAELTAQVTRADSVSYNVLGAGNVNPINFVRSNYVIGINDTVNDSLIVIASTEGNGLCKAIQDTFSILFTPVPIVDAGNDTILCFTETSIQLSANIQNAGGGNWAGGSGTYVPNSQTLAPSYIFSAGDKANGSVTFGLLSLFNGTCQAYIDVMTVSFSDPVVINPLVASSCETAGGGMSLNPDVLNALGYEWKTLGTGSFSPSNTVKDVVYQPSVTDRIGDSVIVRLVAESCTQDSLDFVLFFEPSPQVTASNDLSICVGEANIISASKLNSDGIIWTTSGSGQITPSVNDSLISYSPSAADIALGSITLTVEASKLGCPPVTDSVILTILNEPQINGGADRTLCREVSSIALNGSISNTSAVHWETSGNGNFVNPNNQNTIYNFSSNDRQQDSLYVILISDAFDCFVEQRDSILINFSNSPIVDAGPDQISCSEDAGVVFSGNVTNASGVRWTTLGSGVFDNQFSVSSLYRFSAQDVLAGSVKVIVESIGATICNHDRDTVELSLVTSPLVDAGNDKVYCGEMPGIPLSGVVQDATDWEWFSSGVGSFALASNELSNTYNSSVIDTTIKQIELTLTASINGGCFAFDKLGVIFESPPKIGIENTIACTGDTIQLLGKPIDFISYNADYSWLYNGTLLAAKDSLISITASGNYKVLMSIDECRAEKEATINFNPSPEQFPSKILFICEERTEQLQLDAEGDNLKYYWLVVDDSSKSIIIDQSGVYQYEALNEFNCKTLNNIVVDDVCPPRLFAPTIFTPNGDGKNDFMTIAGKFVEDYNLTVFNRWGEIIYYTKEIDEFWDGNYRGDPMPEGVYNWIIEYVGDERVSERVVIKGIITLVR